MKSLTPDRNKIYGKHMIEIGILIMVINLLTAIFIWQSILAGWKITEGGNFFYRAFLQENGSFLTDMVNPSIGYLLFLRVIFSFLGNREELTIITNILLQFTGIWFFYLGSRKRSGIKKSLIFLLLTATVSAVMFPVISDSPVHFFWAVLGIFFYLLAYCLKTDYRGMKALSILFSFLMGAAIGTFLYVDLSGLLLLLLFFVFWKKEKKKISVVIICFFVTFFSLVSLFSPYSEPKISCLTHWFEQQYSFYLVHIEARNQIISIAILLFSYLLIQYIPLGKTTRRMIPDKINDTEWEIKKEEKIKEDTAIEKIIVQDSSEKVTEYKMENSKEDSKDNEIKAENTTVPGTETTEPVKQIQFLENPLPLPKKRKRKEMDYAFEPSREQMHYDLNNYDVKDDYDLK